MSTSYFFGFGSLVNKNTHSYEDVDTARLHGWRRAWSHTDLRPIAFLTAEPADNYAIDGIIAHVPNNDWDALDAREFAYDRVAVTSQLHHSKPDLIDVSLYKIPDAAKSPKDVRHPILLSYLDVVIQGYLQMFGETGVQNFFDTTTGWDLPIIDDRADPIYPRHQDLSASETALVDKHLIQRQLI